MKKLELLYAYAAWLEAAFEEGRYLRGCEVVGSDGECQWRSRYVRVVGDLVILFTEAGCAAVCRVVQVDQKFQWPANAPAWANVVLASKDDMSMRVFAEDFRDGARAVGVNAGHFVQSSRITLSANHGWIIVASRPSWVPERTARKHCSRPEIAAAYAGANTPPAKAPAPTTPAHGPFAVFKDGMFLWLNLSLDGAVEGARRSAGKNPGAVYTIYRPYY